jgi:putative endopeptidase
MKKLSTYSSLAILLAGSVILLNSCKDNKTVEVNTDEINLANFDTTVKPGNDFFEYVNGGWLKNNAIPASEARWGSFDIANDTNIHRVYKLLTDASADKSKAAGSIPQKVGDYFAMGLDSDKLNKDGIAPLNDELKNINAITDNKSLWAEAARLMKMGSNVMFKFTVGQDDKISSKEICRIEQGGMLLPSKDYYVDTTARMRNIRSKYVEYLTQLFEQMTVDESKSMAPRKAETVLEMETDLANSAMTQIETRDVHAVYNKMTFTDLEKETPSIDWNTCLGVWGLKSIDTILVAQPNFMKKVSEAAKSHSIDDWKTYLIAQLLATESIRYKLSDKITDINFDFWGKTLVGSKVLKPRWRRSVEATNAAVGDLVGQLYVAKYFSPETKEKVHTMVTNIINAYKERINNLTWMSPETKKFAIGKLDKITLKLCYPDKWRDYSPLEIKNDTYAANAFRVNEYKFNYNINRLGKPVDRTEWEMTPQTVNAYYEPTLNEICFPAGILQFPFFDANRDDALNYGGIGVVIGHELTHGFDDQGNQYDGDGNMRKWWTDADSTHYFSKLGLVIRQFDNFEMDSVHVKGKLTIGENTADLGGATIAYQALENDLKQNPEGVVKGFTPEQRFFIGFAQVWRQNARPAYIRQMVNTNPHAPANFRVLGPLANMNEFYTAFNVKPGDAMYRADSLRAVIW